MSWNTDQIEKYRRNAEEARQHAEKAISEVDKESWTKIERTWLQLAEEAKKH